MISLLNTPVGRKFLWGKSNQYFEVIKVYKDVNPTTYNWSVRCYMNDGIAIDKLYEAVSIAKSVVKWI